MRVLVNSCFTGSVLVLSLLFAGCSVSPDKNNVANASTVPLGQNASAIDLHDFYKLPAGPLGLKPTEKLANLKDKRVRIVGYMVKEEEPTVGLFMLTTMPVNLSEKEDGPADDLPPATLYVHMPQADANKAVAFRPGLWEVIGTLKLGNQEEANGRMSYTQLILDDIRTQQNN